MPSKLKILIIDDEPEIRKYLRAILSANSIDVIEGINSRDAVSKIIGNNPDLIILDLGLPDKDGQELICELRDWCKLPIIVLSARDNDQEKVKALENGADDYLTKPFSSNELLARIKVAMRHVNNSDASKNHVYEYKSLKIDFAARMVWRDNIEINLTPIEYKLLTTLAKSAGKAITHTQLINGVWGKRANEDTAYLRIHTQHLREKLNDDPISPTYIITLPGVGYKLNS